MTSEILTLDLATSTGWAQGEPGGKVVSGFIILGTAGATEAERYAALFRFLWTHLSAFKPREIVYEASLPPGAKQGFTTRDTAAYLFGLAGVVECAAYMRGVYSIRKANVQDVRGFFIGKRGFIYRGKPIVGRRNSPSAEAKFCTVERCRELGYSPANHDEADAIALHAFVSSIRAPATAATHTPLFEHPGAAA